MDEYIPMTLSSISSALCFVGKDENGIVQCRSLLVGLDEFGNAWQFDQETQTWYKLPPLPETMRVRRRRRQYSETDPTEMN